MSASQCVPENTNQQESHPADRRGAAPPHSPTMYRLPARASGPVGWPSIAYNISATGIGVTLPRPLPQGAVVEIEAWGLPSAPRLRARVVHSRFTDFLWFCGCQLAKPLSEEELRAWLKGPTDWLPKGQAARPL